MRTVYYLSQKTFFIALLFLFGLISIPELALCYTKGDINNDEKIDLVEAIHALSVTADIRIAASANIISVRKNDPTADFQNIQEAIDAASDGDTINVGAGEYNEKISIIGKRLILQGENRDTTVIMAGGKETEDTVIFVADSRVQISGFTIKDGKYGVYAKDAKILFRNNKINSTYAGFSGRDIDTTIENTLSSSNSYSGFEFGNNSSVRLNNCESSNNNGAGISVSNSSYALIEYCISKDNGKHGVFSNTSSTFIITHSDLSSNARQGVFITNGSSAVLAGNTIQNNGKMGVAVYINSSAILGGENNISGNVFHGVTVIHSSSAQVGFIIPGFDGQDMITDNGNQGIRVDAVSSIWLQKVTISNHAGLDQYGRPNSGILLLHNSHLFIENVNPANTKIINNNRGIIRSKDASYAMPMAPDPLPDFSGNPAIICNNCGDVGENDIDGDGWTPNQGDPDDYDITAYGLAYSCHGTYATIIEGQQEPSNSGNFQFQYNFNRGSIVLFEMCGTECHFQVSLVSTDGVNYTPDPQIYGDNPPDITVTISGQTISGTLTLVTTYHGEPEPFEETSVTTLSGTCP